jgi:RNA polymerase sigma-70 factor (ECF subfamily)
MALIAKFQRLNGRTKTSRFLARKVVVSHSKPLAIPMPVEINPTAKSLSGKILLEELYASSNAKSYGLTEEHFSEILASIPADSGSPSTGTSPESQADFYRSLKLEELALARGCAWGDDNAWEVFLTRYREKLYDAARYITKEDSSARELADSLYADLYGTANRDGVRVSKLSSYRGRGSLEGWLRTVLAQEWVNRYRKRKREVSLEEEEEGGAQFATSGNVDSGQVRTPVVLATDSALAELSPEDRYVLSSYYLDKRTLAEIARTLRVHESTISRKVEKLAKVIRKRILENLVKRGMSRRQAEEAMEFDVRDWPADVRSSLVRGAIPSSSSLSAANTQESTREAFQVVEEKKDKGSI